MGMSAYMKKLRQQVGDDLLIVPSVAAVIHDLEGRLCLQRNREGYSLPAGGIEPGETPADALRREVREETGLILTAVHLLDMFGGADFRHRYPNGDQVEYVVGLYRCEVALGDLSTDDETLAVEWHDVDRLPSLAMPWPDKYLRP